MTTFDPTEHPRANDGTFTEKTHTNPEIALSASDAEATFGFYDRVSDRTRDELWQAQKRHVAAITDAFMAEAKVLAPSAVKARFAYDAEADSWDFVEFYDADGNEVYLDGDYPDTSFRGYLDWSDVKSGLFELEMEYDPSTGFFSDDAYLELRDPAPVTEEAVQVEAALKHLNTISLTGRQAADVVRALVQQNPAAAARVTGWTSEDLNRFHEERVAPMFAELARGL